MVVYIFVNIAEKSSIPSVTFLRVRSISAMWGYIWLVMLCFSGGGDCERGSHYSGGSADYEVKKGEVTL